MKNFYFRIAVIAGLALLLIPSISLAQAEKDFSTLGCVANPVSCMIYGLNIVVAGLGSMLIVFGALIAKYALSLSFDLTNSPAVQRGFEVFLAFANIGFVVGIIAIAIATILRNQTYGIKQILWKLVFMAILVNFGLIISGTLIGFSDQISTYLIKSSAPEGEDYFAFTERLADSFAPQALFKSGQEENACEKTKTCPGVFEKIKRKLKDLDESDSDEDVFSKSLAGLIFTTVFTLLMAVVFLLIAAMLFIRYFWLTFLLIVLPIAWLSWIFPMLKTNWDKWWKNFIRWTFFAPAMMFFIYLAMYLALNNPQYSNQRLDETNSEQTSAEFLHAMDKGEDFLPQLASQILIIGLLVGGIMAANSMGITFADSTMKGAKGVQKWAQGAVGRSAKRAGVRTVGGDTMKKASERLQRFGAGGGAFTRTLTAPIRGIGQGIDSMRKTSRSIVADYKGKIKDLNGEQILNQISSKRGAELIAYLQQAKEKKVLGAAVGKLPADALDDSLFMRAGEEKFGNEVKNVSGLAFLQYAKERAIPGADHATIDAKLEKSIKDTDAENFANFFKPFDPSKPPLGMTEAQFKQTQAELVKGLAFYGSPQKIRKVFEDDNFTSDRANQFKDAGTRAGLTDALIQANNPKLAQWLSSSKAAGVVDINSFMS